MNISSQSFAVEILNRVSGNCQIRFYQENTCIVVSVYGPKEVGAARAALEGVLEVQIKMEPNMDTVYLATTSSFQDIIEGIRMGNKIDIREKYQIARLCIDNYANCYRRVIK